MTSFGSVSILFAISFVVFAHWEGQNVYSDFVLLLTKQVPYFYCIADVFRLWKGVRILCITQSNRRLCGFFFLNSVALPVANFINTPAECILAIDKWFLGLLYPDLFGYC